MSRESLQLQIIEGLNKDVGRGVVRLDPAHLERLGLEVGDAVELIGEASTVARTLPLHREHRGRDCIQMDGILRQNTGASLGDTIEVAPTTLQPAGEVVLEPVSQIPSDRDLDYLGSLVDGVPVRRGDRMRVTLFANKWIDFQVEQTTPGGGVIINPTTELLVQEPDEGEEAPSSSPRISYEDVGGLDEQLPRIREMIELPLRNPEVFEQLGIDAPSGVLLQGPPGCGKTLLARAIAAETDASFFSISGPEVIDKLYGESEAQLREIFDEAEREAPSIVFIDEIDAIAPKRDQATGDVEKRVVATMLTLMDGLQERRNVVVIGATNRPDAIDPALRRAGRFDREIEIPVPDRVSRRDILSIHSRGMPLADDVDLDELADQTHGYVGADLEALCREAAMSALRRRLPEAETGSIHLSPETLRSLEVASRDFQEAFGDIQPAATREVFVEVPDVSWDDVGGLEEAKERLIETVEWPLRYPELYDRADLAVSKGILLAGPPGCGKTMLAKAAATETDINFIPVKGPSLLSKFVGESERNVREVFEKAREASPCILFFDEIDALTPERSSHAADSNVSARVLDQFLAELDGIEALEEVVVLGATNRIDMMDRALLRPGRFDDVIEVEAPDRSARRQILEIHLGRRPTVEGLDADEWLDATEGFTGADIAAVCRRASMEAIRRLIREGEDGEPDPDDLIVAPSDVSRALEAFRAERQGRS
jgi:transitional endoplasmic reticulum ATPase